MIALGRSIYSNKGLTKDLSPSMLRDAVAESSVFDPPDPQGVARLYHALLTRHTASDGRVPTVIPDAGAVPAWPAEPSNRYDIAATELAARWQQRLEEARSLVASHGIVHVLTELAARDTRDVTYRRDREPVSQEQLLQEAAELLHLAPTQLRHTTAGNVSPLVVIAAQARDSAAVPHVGDACLVVDQYLEPHMGWLASLKL